MKLFRLDAAKIDHRYCYTTGVSPIAGMVEASTTVVPRMEKLEIDRIDLKMDEDRGGLELSDWVSNPANLLALSKDCKDAILEGFDIGPHELVDCRLINKKGRDHGGEYTIVNLLGKQDCLNQQLSELDPNVPFLRVKFMGRWCLDAKKVPALDLFRVDGVIGYIFSERLVDLIGSRGFTNFPFDPVPLC